MKVALIQMNSGADKAANIEAARALIDQAVAEEKPDWICLPEVFDFLGGNFAQKQAAAEAKDGSGTRFDPKVVAAFTTIVSPGFEGISITYKKR